MIKARTSPINKILYHHYVKSTAPDNKDNLLILHGIMGHGGLYKHLATNPSVIPHYSSYLLDFRNHGKSFWTDEMTV